MTNPDLTPAELQMAQSFGMTPEEYAAHRTREGAADWNSPDGEARRREDAERERLKRAVREALDEKDAA